jgi:asparagine synthase (glutamine-hydrolysing)
VSGICAIVNFDGSPVASDVLRRMAAGMAGRGPDGMNLRVDENAGLAHLALNTTPESLRERQPLPGREQRRGAKRLPVS